MRKKIFYCSPNKSMDFMWSDEVSATIYSIANTLFMLEKRIKKNLPPDTVSIDYYMNLSNEKIKEISKLLNAIILDVLYENIRFIFVKKNLNEKTGVPNFEKNETICLFSGGIDSTLGILKSKEYYNDVLGLYVAHQDFGKITYKVNRIINNILTNKEIDAVKFMAPAMGRGYSQLRGLLYVLYSSILAYFVDAKRVIVSECGVTMYQPKFAPMDTVTYTTHPLVLKTSKKIAEIILNRPLDIVLPFENFTKTEMMKLIADDSILSQTHSCITGRWDKNCGTCYACIARMIGSINLGLSINYFKNNVFEIKDDESLSSLLNFCINFELEKEEVDRWSLKTIEIYNKQELFRKFCQDVFLCLKKLEDKGDLDINYEFILDHYLEQKNGALILREKEIQNFNGIPDFNKKVS